MTGRSEEGSKCSKFWKILKSRLMLFFTLTGIFLGFIFGFIIRLIEPSDELLMWIGMPGEAFLNALTMPVIPLIVSSVVVASASLDPKENGKLGILLLVMNFGTNFMCSLLGVILAISIQPGKSINTFFEMEKKASAMKAQDIAADLIRNIVPNNIVRTTLQKAMTTYSEKEMNAFLNASLSRNTSEIASNATKREIIFIDSPNIIGLLFCSVVFGLAAGTLKEKGKPFVEFFKSANAIIVILIQWFIWIAPFGIMSLIAASIAAIDNIGEMMIKLGYFVGSVTLGLAIHQLILIPTIFAACTKKNPFKIHVLNVKAWCVTFATANSAAAMPYMYGICRHLNINDQVASIGIPMSVTLNGSGSSLFINCAVIFLSQLNIVVLNAGQIITLLLLTSFSTMALPAAPSSSIVIIMIFCTIFGLPVQSVGILFTMEWFLDRLRSTSNFVSEIFLIALTWNCVKSDFVGENLEHNKCLNESLHAGRRSGSIAVSIEAPSCHSAEAYHESKYENGYVVADV